jgi:Uma2 family endonuclease
MPLSNVLVPKHTQIESSEKDYSEVVYPDSDGAPMGETEFHVIATLHLYDALRHFFQNTPDIYVAADMFLYYQEGNPRANKAPDVMVIKGVKKRKRRTFKVWEEGAVPCVIFEITSKATMIEDTISKSILYASLGVCEYFLFDPLKEYLDTGLTGFSLEEGEYIPLKPDKEGFLFSTELEAFLAVEDDMLRIIDPETHKPVPALNEAIAKAEQEAQRAEQEAQRAEQEAQRAEQERRRAETAEAELARLRTLLNTK